MLLLKKIITNQIRSYSKAASPAIFRQVTLLTQQALKDKALICII